MPSLPQGQNYYDPYSFLEAWIERHGFLTDLEQARFLRDPRLLEILTHHKYSVEASLDEFKYFDQIIEDLNLKLSLNYDHVEITPEDLGMEEDLGKEEDLDMEVDLGVGEDIGMEEDPPAGPKYYS
jgi:hypothetical protein